MCLAKNLILAWSCWLLVLAIAPLSANAEEASQDLSALNFDEQTSLILEGPWEFYWQTLLESPNPSRAPDALVKGGLGWRSISLASGPLPAEGFASYRLTIKGIQPADQRYTLKVPAMEGAMRFHLYDASDGREIASAHAGNFMNKTIVSSKRDQFVSFIAKSGHEYILVVQLANEHDARGSFMDMIVLWKDDIVIRQRDQDGLLNALCLGVCLASGFSTILIWVRRRSDTASLYLFLVSMAGVGRIISTNQSILSYFDDSYYPSLKSLEYASMALSMVFCQFIHHAFPQVPIKKFLIRGYLALTILLFSISWILPPMAFTALLSYYQVSILVGAIMVAYLIGGALIKRLPGALLAATGCLVIIGAVGFDIFLVNRLKMFSFFLSPIGVAIYMTLQAQLVAVQSALTYKLAEHLAVENEKAQKALRIETETRFGLATAVAHRLNNPLNYIQMGINDIRTHVDTLSERIRTLLAPSSEEDAEIKAVRDSFDQIFEDLKTPFSHAQKGLLKASKSIQEIRSLSGIDGLSVERLNLAYVIKEVSERMTEQIDGTSYRRLSFRCQQPEANLNGNLYLLKNVIEVFIGHSLQMSEGPILVSAEADNEPPLWMIRLSGKLSQDADEWQILAERLSYVLRPIGAKLSIDSIGDDRILAIQEPPIKSTLSQVEATLPLAS